MRLITGLKEIGLQNDKLSQRLRSGVRLPDDKIGIKSMIVIKIKLKLSFEDAPQLRDVRDRG